MWSLLFLYVLLKDAVELPRVPQCPPEMRARCLSPNDTRVNGVVVLGQQRVIHSPIAECLAEQLEALDKKFAMQFARPKLAGRALWVCV
jgi:hypothetical protein